MAFIPNTFNSHSEPCNAEQKFKFYLAWKQIYDFLAVFNLLRNFWQLQEDQDLFLRIDLSFLISSIPLSIFCT